MNTKTSKPLILAFIIVVIVFLLLCGSAITITINDAVMNGNRMMSSISWMWAPTILALLLIILLGWAIFWKKKND